MDPWYAFGSGDMLEVAHMGLHVAQMTSVAAMMQCFAAVTSTPARILGLERYGIAPDHNADFVLLQATSPADAIRLRATRLAVVRRGKVIARSPANTAAIELPGRPKTVDFRR
jgi:cytosine deaminase